MKSAERAKRNAKVVELHHSGFSGDEIARLIGLNRATIFRIIQHLKVSGYLVPDHRCAVRWTADMDAELRAMAEAGLGVTPCSERLGVCKEVVTRRRKELGLPDGLRGWHGRQNYREWWHGRQGLIA